MNPRAILVGSIFLTTQTTNQQSLHIFLPHISAWYYCMQKVVASCIVLQPKLSVFFPLKRFGGLLGAFAVSYPQILTRFCSDLRTQSFVVSKNEKHCNKAALIGKEKQRRSLCRVWFSLLRYCRVG